MSRYTCSFSYYHGNIKTADVTIKDGVVTTVPYTDEKLDLPFGFVSDRNVTRTTIDLFFERHCVQSNRNNIRQILDYYGLDEFDEYELCRKTNGEMGDHEYRIEWTDQ